MKFSLYVFFAMLVAGLFPGQSQADLLASRYNISDSLVIDTNRFAWASLIAYPNDSSSEEGVGERDADWQYVAMANSTDESTLFIRYVMINNGADFSSSPAIYNMYIDTDKKRKTGFIGTNSQLPIGADILIQGSSVFAFNGQWQISNDWNLKQQLTADNSFTNRDIIFSIPVSVLSDSTSFYFVLVGDNEINGHSLDYYPDRAPLGYRGDFFKYSTEVGEDDDGDEHEEHEEH